MSRFGIVAASRGGPTRNSAMDDACRSVGIQLDRAVSDLDAVGHKLEAHFAASYGHLPGAQHPHALLERVQRLTAQLPQLAADCEEIATAKAMLETTAAASMVANAASIRELELLSGAQPACPA